MQGETPVRVSVAPMGITTRPSTDTARPKVDEVQLTTAPDDTFDHYRNRHSSSIVHFNPRPRRASDTLANLIMYMAQVRTRGSLRALGARAPSPRLAEGRPTSSRARMPALPGGRWSQGGHPRAPSPSFVRSRVTEWARSTSLLRPARSGAFLPPIAVRPRSRAVRKPDTMQLRGPVDKFERASLWRVAGSAPRRYPEKQATEDRNRTAPPCHDRACRTRQNRAPGRGSPAFRARASNSGITRSFVAIASSATAPIR